MGNELPGKGLCEYVFEKSIIQLPNQEWAGELVNGVWIFDENSPGATHLIHKVKIIFDYLNTDRKLIDRGDPIFEVGFPFDNGRDAKSKLIGDSDTAKLAAYTEFYATKLIDIINNQKWEVAKYNGQ